MLIGMSNISRAIFSVKKQFRENQKNQRGVAIWFTGLSGAGKTTIANELDQLLIANNNHSYILDGDVFRSGLSSDLSFTKNDRQENLRRIKYVAAMFCDAGIVSLVTFISPFQEDRQKARDLLGENYVEVFVKASLETAEKRDPKGLYEKARKGEIKNFTGIDSPYEEPQIPEIVLDTEHFSAAECALKIFKHLKQKNFIK